MDYPSIYKMEDGRSIIMMRFLAKFIPIIMIGTVLLPLFVGTQANTGATEMTRVGPPDNANNTLNLTMDVLIDFGNTRYQWVTVNLTGNNNTAFNATQLACDMQEFEFNYSISEMGIFLNGIDAVFNAADWSVSWSLFIWNATTGKWELSPVGADQYILSVNGSIAWLYDNWGDTPPVPTPLEPYPDLVKNHVLIDFGNGSYRWEDTILAGEASAYNATQQACLELGFDLDHSTTEYGIFLNGINGIANAVDWSESWSLFVWNETSLKWETSAVGAGQYMLGMYEKIAWLYDNWGDSPPVPTPLVADPVLVKTDVLIDFGNGSFLWEDVILPYSQVSTQQASGSRSADSASGMTGEPVPPVALDAYRTAAYELGLDMSIVNTSFGPYISGVGGIEGEGNWFWAVLEFTNGSWNYSDVGAGNLSVKDGRALGLYYTVWGYPLPVSDPLDPYPATEKFRPMFSNYSLEYLGNNTYSVNITVESDYNLPRDISFFFGNDSQLMSQNPADNQWWTTEVSVTENFTYHFNSSMGVAPVSTAAVASLPGTRDLWLDRKNAGEFGSEEPSNNSGQEVEVEVEPGEEEVIYLENPTGDDNVKIRVRGNGTLVARVMDWEEASKKTGDIETGLDHTGFFLEITLSELEWMLIEIPYDPSELAAGSDEESLALYFWNITSDKWERINDSWVDADKNIIGVNVTHLTIFAPMSTQRDISGEDGEGGSNLYIIIVLAVVIALVILFMVIFIWKRGKSEGEEDREELPDELDRTE